MNDSIINIRVEKKLKNQCELIFNELGLGLTSGITIYLKAVARLKSIPFSLTTDEPNLITLKAFQEVEDISRGKKRNKTYKNSKELRKDLKV